jgi:hypothetical protein
MNRITNSLISIIIALRHNLLAAENVSTGSSNPS